MNHADMAQVILAAGGGLLLGAMFHLGLWWTIKRGLEPAASALWFPASLVLRWSLTVAGFHLIGAGHLERLLACLGGFGGAQLLATRFAPAVGATLRLHRSTGHAS